MLPSPLLALFTLLALAAPPAWSAGIDNEECSECGLRKPGVRPRELAILEAAEGVMEAAKRSPSAMKKLKEKSPSANPRPPREKE